MTIAATQKPFLDAVAGFVPEAPLVVLQRLHAAVDLYLNEDTQSVREAREAICWGRAAYWSTVGYSAARACRLLDLVNQGMPIADALEDAYPGKLRDENCRRGALDTLVPLNRLATVALAAAYSKYATWVEADELESRRVRHAAAQRRAL